MEYEKFLNRIIDDGIAAAKKDYDDAAHEQHLEGSIDGFAACRNLGPLQLIELYRVATVAAADAYSNQKEKYWYCRCYQAEVEWVLNVISASLYNEGLPPLLSHHPTVNAMFKAAEILGVSSIDNM